jgi:hypothetical protein
MEAMSLSHGLDERTKGLPLENDSSAIANVEPATLRDSNGMRIVSIVHRNLGDPTIRE